MKDQTESIKVELEEKVVQENEPDEDDASKSKLEKAKIIFFLTIFS